MVDVRYTEAIVLFKSLPDAVWHGSALEGLAVVSMLESWSAGQGLVCLYLFHPFIPA